ncbi:MAG: MlaD family protein [Mariprofundaceae bacterium]|nr:MlaD family protein [Mariprofundaceae bacterium]
MSQTTLDSLPHPHVKTQRVPSLVWLLPCLTLLIGGWLVFKTLHEQGPEVTIVFKNAAGIKAGKTRIKYKDLEIGVVKSIGFSEDFSHVLLHASLSREAEPFLRRDSHFWVVKPRLSIRGVSGLATLVSGSYIELEPGEGAPWRDYVGLESPPVVKATMEGKELTLITKRLGSIDHGSPLYYQGIQVGEVLGYELANDHTGVFVHAFVKTPYDTLIHSNTHFWNASGMDVEVSTQGLHVRAESLLSIMLGGIAFETPTTVNTAADDIDGLVFTLYESRQAIREHDFAQKILFVAFFDGSIRGLEVNAPVELKGIKVGRVADIHLEFDATDTSFHIPVLIELEPERIVSRHARDTQEDPHAVVKILIERGLRAQLKTGSLLTGQLFVDLDMLPATPLHLLSYESDYPQLPTVAGNMAQMTASVKSILNKIEALDLNAMSSQVVAILEGTNALVHAPELRQSMTQARDTLALFHTMLEHLNPKVDGMATNINQTIVAGRAAITQSEQTLKLMNQLLDPQAPMQYRVQQMMVEVAEMARSVRVLVDVLERNPDAIIYGKKEE